MIETKELFFREKDSPGKYGHLGGGLKFSGINDLIEQIENSKIPPHGLDKLIISKNNNFFFIIYIIKIMSWKVFYSFSNHTDS